MNAQISGRFNFTITYCKNIYSLVGICVSQSNKFITTFCTVVTDFCTLVTDSLLLSGINCTEIDQSQSSIISVYIIKICNILHLQVSMFTDSS